MKNDNILIQDIVLFSEFLMKAKKAKAEKSKSKKTGKKSTKKRTKKSADLSDDTGIVLIDDDLKEIRKRNWKNVEHIWKKLVLKRLLTKLNLYSF